MTKVTFYFHWFPRMHRSFLLLLVVGTAAMCVALTSTLHGFRGCAVREFSFVAHKPGCKGLRVTTEACWGRCHTWEVTFQTVGLLTANPGLGGDAEWTGPEPKPQESWRPSLDSEPRVLKKCSKCCWRVGGGGGGRTLTDLVLLRRALNFTSA